MIPDLLRDDVDIRISLETTIPQNPDVESRRAGTVYANNLCEADLFIAARDLHMKLRPTATAWNGPQSRADVDPRQQILHSAGQLLAGTGVGDGRRDRSIGRPQMTKEQRNLVGRMLEKHCR